jgi:hypothetical protein
MLSFRPCLVSFFAAFWPKIAEAHPNASRFLLRFQAARLRPAEITRGSRLPNTRLLRVSKDSRVPRVFSRPCPESQVESAAVEIGALPAHLPVHCHVGPLCATTHLPGMLPHAATRLPGAPPGRSSVRRLLPHRCAATCLLGDPHARARPPHQSTGDVLCSAISAGSSGGLPLDG